MELINGRMAHMCAPNDENGNPQRLYAGCFEIKGIPTIQCWDEGYLGHHAVPEEYREAAYAAERIEMSEDQYHLWMECWGQ